jgi:hypothetical protein
MEDVRQMPMQITGGIVYTYTDSCEPASENFSLGSNIAKI